MSQTKNPPTKEGFLNIPGNDLLSHASLPRSTIGATGLNCRVRNGNGCFPCAIITGKFFLKKLWEIDGLFHNDKILVKPFGLLVLLS